MKKTNAMRELDKAKIAYQSYSYEVGEEHVSAIDVALRLGQDIQRVFKTLVLWTEKKEMIVACIPASDSIDLKKLAKVLDCKKVEMLEMKTLFSMTGYVRGGCSPIGILKRHRTVLHQSALNENTMIVSAGQRGLQVELEVSALQKHVHAIVADIVL